MRNFLLLMAVVLPQPLKQFLYRRVFGWQIGKGVQIGLSFLQAGEVTLGDHVKIGHFNIFRNLKRVVIGEGTYIANFNQIFGAAYPHWKSELIVGEKVDFMSRHFVDVGGSVEIGNRVVMGGRDTQIWSHSRTVVSGPESLQPSSVRIGDDVYVGARATLIGCDIPAGALVGAGSVVLKSFAPEACRLLIAGNPAAIRKRYEEEGTDSEITSVLNRDNSANL